MDQPAQNPLDILPPARIARLVTDVGVRKARMNLPELLTLAVLAGAFIGFGGMAAIVALTGSDSGLGTTRLVAGVAFSLGLILVIIGGAELFTGNNLLVMAAASGAISPGALLRNWGIVYIGNFAGALGLVAFAHLSGVFDGSFGDTAQTIAGAKLSQGMKEAFFRGILCNILVCLAVWMSFAAHSASGKVLMIVFPVTAFVALGFEHSVANMFLIPLGMLQSSDAPELGSFLSHLATVTAGNIVGGGLFVGLVYWLVYGRNDTPER